METTKRALGLEHPDTVTNMGNHVATVRYQGDWRAACACHADKEEGTRPRASDTVTSMNNLATIYPHQRRWKEPEELQTQVVDILQVTLGDDHLSTVQAVANLDLLRKTYGTLRHILRVLAKYHEGYKLGTDEQRLELALAMSLESGEGPDTQCCQPSRPSRPRPLRTACRPMTAGDGKSTVIGRHPPSPADIGRLLLIHIL